MSTEARSCFTSSVNRCWSRCCSETVTVPLRRPRWWWWWSLDESLPHDPPLSAAAARSTPASASWGNEHGGTTPSPSRSCWGSWQAAEPWSPSLQIRNYMVSWWHSQITDEHSLLISTPRGATTVEKRRVWAQGWFKPLLRVQTCALLKLCMRGVTPSVLQISPAASPPEYKSQEHLHFPHASLGRFLKTTL